MGGRRPTALRCRVGLETWGEQGAGPSASSGASTRGSRRRGSPAMRFTSSVSAVWGQLGGVWGRTSPARSPRAPRPCPPLMYSTVPSSTRLSSGSNPFRMPLACRNHREEKQRGVREAAVLGPVQSGYPMCRCGGQPLQGRERRDTGSGVRVRAGSRPEARRSSPTPPQNGASNVFAKGLWGSFSSVGPWSGPVVWARGLHSNHLLGLPG